MKDKLVTDKNVATVCEYSNDVPLVNPEDDLLNRRKFSQKIAELILNRKDNDCLVVSIMGSWGEGKTTVINFINKIMLKENIIVINYNPWRYADEETMLKGFFNDLAHALGKSINNKEKIGKLIEKYSSSLATVQLFGIPFFNALYLIGKRLSQTSVDDFKKKIEDVLIDANKKIVVFIDDIDRLEQDEICILFKIIKLTADFPLTTYVLGFDDEVVASALEKKYFGGNSDTGKSFLEKIVQVPIHLPKMQTELLAGIFDKEITRIFNIYCVQLTEDEWRNFSGCFFSGILGRAKTPRNIKRYCNAIEFSLSLLKDEVNYVDLLIIESVRVFYPKVYDEIKMNSHLFIGDIGERSSEVQVRLDYQNKLIDEYPLSDRNGLIVLLVSLFPQLRGLGDRFGNSIVYNEHYTEAWDNGKRIASNSYFLRYFVYDVPMGDYSDREFMAFIKDLSILSKATLSERISDVVLKKAMPKFISKLRAVEKELDEESAEKIATTLCNYGAHFDNPDVMFAFMQPFTQAAMLISRCVGRITDLDRRSKCAREVLENAKPLIFGIECLRWIRIKEEGEASLFTVEQETLLASILAHRVEDECKRDVPIFIKKPKEASSYLYTWFKWGSADEVRQYLASLINEDTVIAFINCFRPTSWSVGTGVRSRGRLMRQGYDAISELINPVYIQEMITKRYSPLQQEGKSRLDETDEKQAATMFSEIHLAVQKEKSTQGVK